MNITFIEATTLSDLWFQAIYNILEKGRRFIIDRGSYAGQTRLEYDYFIGQIKTPGADPILPVIPPGCDIPPPVEHDYVYGGPDYDRSYIEYIMTPTKLPGESYTYGERLTKAELYDMSDQFIHSYDFFVDQIKNNVSNHCIFKEDETWYINQVESIIETYKQFGYRNNQLVLQVAQPSDLILEDPPCLRHIDCRIQDNKLHFFVYFRSWDLYSGTPANLAGIQALKEYMAGEIGVEDGEMIVESKGLHIYGYAEDFAKMRCFKDM